MHPLIVLAGLAVAFAVLWWGGPVDVAAGELERRRLVDRERRAAQRRRPRGGGEVDQLRRLGPRRPRNTSGVWLDDVPEVLLDAARWRRLRDGLARTHDRS